MYTKLTFAAGALVLASACGSSSSNPDEVSREITGADAFNIGSQSTSAAATGLPFANDVDPDTFEFDDSPITVRLARFETDYETGESRIIISEETLTIPLDAEGLEGTFTYKGETVTFVDLGDGPEAELSNGQTLIAFVNSEGIFGQAISVYTYDDADVPTGFDSEGNFVIGLETNPTVLASLPAGPEGFVFYQGEFDGYGNLLDLNGDVSIQEVQIDGDVFVEVAFGTGDIGGSLSFEALEGGIGDVVSFDTSLSGNGFSATASDVLFCETCTSASQIGGAFFGPNAEELIGMAGIDYTDPDFEGGVRLVGAGSYVAIEAD